MAVWSRLGVDRRGKQCQRNALEFRRVDRVRHITPDVFRISTLFPRRDPRTREEFLQRRLEPGQRRMDLLKRQSRASILRSRSAMTFMICRAKCGVCWTM